MMKSAETITLKDMLKRDEMFSTVHYGRVTARYRINTKGRKTGHIELVNADGHVPAVFDTRGKDTIEIQLVEEPEIKMTEDGSAWQQLSILRSSNGGRI
jgi:hypothetical protein